MFPRLRYLLVLPALIWGCGETERASEVDRAKPGYSQFVLYCSPCHGKTGRGAPRIFPPLVGESWVNLDPEIPISIVLKGLEGRLTMEGQEYMNQMAPLENRMTDAKIAETLTFVRSSFGNTSSAVTPEQVAAVRKQIKDRKQKWTVEEMQERIALAEQE